MPASSACRGAAAISTGTIVSSQVSSGSDAAGIWCVVRQAWWLHQHRAFVHLPVPRVLCSAQHASKAPTWGVGMRIMEMLVCQYITLQLFHRPQCCGCATAVCVAEGDS